MLKQVQHDKTFRDDFCGVIPVCTVIPNLIRDLKGTGLRSKSFGESEIKAQTDAEPSSA